MRKLKEKCWIKLKHINNLVRNIMHAFIHGCMFIWRRSYINFTLATKKRLFELQPLKLQSLNIVRCFLLKVSSPKGFVSELSRLNSLTPFVLNCVFKAYLEDGRKRKLSDFMNIITFKLRANKYLWWIKKIRTKSWQLGVTKLDWI